MIDIGAALSDPAMFEPWFHGSSWGTWRAVARAAFGVPLSRNETELFRGVAGVRNFITVRPPASPEAVEAAIEQAFRREAEVDARHVKVEVLPRYVKTWHFDIYGRP